MVFYASCSCSLCLTFWLNTEFSSTLLGVFSCHLKGFYKYVLNNISRTPWPCESFRWRVAKDRGDRVGKIWILQSMAVSLSVYFHLEVVVWIQLTCQHQLLKVNLSFCFTLAAAAAAAAASAAAFPPYSASQAAQLVYQPAHIFQRFTKVLLWKLLERVDHGQRCGYIERLASGTWCSLLPNLS